MELSEEVVLAKARAEKLDGVKTLNLWGNDIRGMAILRRMPNVEVLSLSVNKVTHLEEFAQCPKLQELYLRKNEVADLHEVRYLQQLKHLRVLWLSDNPCADTPDYRHTVLRYLPGLTKLDNTEVSDDERQKARAASPVPAPSPSPPPPPAPEAAPAAAESRGPGTAAAAAAATAAPGEQTTPSAAVAAAREGGVTRAQTLKRSGSSSSNVLYAVVSLLSELDLEGLELIKTEVEERIAAASVST